MLEQQPDLRRSLRILRRRLTAITILAVAGFLAGAGYTYLFDPPMHQATALVVLPATTSGIGTQAVIVTSGPVLEAALPSIKPATSVTALRGRVKVTPVGGDVLSIMAQGATPAQAQDAANAVADSYVTYVSAANTPVGQVLTRILAPARDATATRLPLRMAATAIIGLVCGTLIGVVGALATGRRSGRLRERDEIADAIGVPVLASVPVAHPSDAAGWAKLFEDYQPSVNDAWRMRHALTDLNLTDGQASESSLTVVSLASDQRALALGPQLARFAAADGVPTTLVIGPEHVSRRVKVPGTVKALHAAATAATAQRSGRLRVTVSDRDGADRQPGTALSVVVQVLDEQAPRLAGLARTNATVIGVSAGAATAAQLARVAASAASSGRPITGILVADPEPADPTTGRFPQLARSAQDSMPTRLTGTLR